MSTSMMALAIAGIMVMGLVIGLGAVSLLVGALEQYWGRPKLTFLRSLQGKNGIAFRFQWNESKEPAQYHVLKLKLFNPFGKPTQVELARPFEKKGESFNLDLDMGPAMGAFLRTKGLEQARVQVELESLNGVSYLEEFKAPRFMQLLKEASETVGQSHGEEGDSSWGAESFWVVNRDFIADTVPGKGAQVALPTNPSFAAFFQQTAGTQGAADAQEQEENFSVGKVWIEDGCIVCNACEDIYPEVFKVIADGCEVRPGHPTDDGLKVQDAAEACPVEIIKFAKVA